MEIEKDGNIPIPNTPDIWKLKLKNVRDEIMKNEDCMKKLAVLSIFSFLKYTIDPNRYNLIEENYEIKNFKL